MKQPIHTALILLSTFSGLTLFAPQALAQTTQPGKIINFGDRVTIQAGMWLTTGEAEWTERGGAGDGLIIDRYRSLLEYNNTDSTMFLVEGDVKLTERFSLGARFATGSIDDAKGADNDWIDGPGITREFYVSRSENDLDGDTQLWDIELKYHLADMTPKNVKLNVYGAYGNYTDEFISSNGRQVLIDESPVSSAIGGLASTYDFEWNSLTVGLDGQWQSPNSGWNLSGRLGVMPWVDYEGEAFWNLRTDFKRSAPNFVHEADGGLGFEGRVAVGYDWKSLNGQLGYWFRTYDVDGGVSETFFADGSSGFSNLDASATRQGVFGTVGITF